MPAWRICLINMPFAALDMPSLALTRLSAALRSRFGARISVEVHYLNLDFARLLGVEFYRGLTESLESQNRGLGEWFFRQAAFRELPDNSEAYFARYFPYNDDASAVYRQSLLRGREQAEHLLDQLIGGLGLDRADLVGFTSVFSQNTASFALARRIKGLNPNTITVMGGSNCETPMGEVISCRVPWIDYVFSGPALKSFPDALEYLLVKQPLPGRAIAGVFSRGNPAPADPLGEEADLDTESALDYDSYLEALERSFPAGEIEPHLLFRTSRGCWWGERCQCAFCGLNGTRRGYRAMSPETALAQFGRLLRYYPRCRSFKAVDNLMPREYLQQVWPRLHLPPEARIFYEVRSDLTAEDLAVLKNAGVRQVQPGIEALATSTLRLIGKGTTAFRNLQFLKNCLRFAVKPVWNLLVGFPGEDAEVYRKYITDIPLLTHLPPPTGVFPVRFDRYSPYFRKADAYGLDLAPCDFYGFIYPFPEEDLRRLAYSFMDHNFGAAYYQNMVVWIDRLRRQIKDWRERWEAAAGAPRLCFGEDGEGRVYDSRSVGLRVHEIGSVGRRVLENLNAPGTLAALNDRLGHLSGFEAGREVAALRQQGLVFQEGGQFLSLVLPGKNQATVGSGVRFEAWSATPAEAGAGAVPTLQRLRREDFRSGADPALGGLPVSQKKDRMGGEDR